MSALREGDDPAPRQVDIGGRRLAVQVKGSGPTVVLEVGAGGGGIGPAWNGVDDRLAEFATVIVYDRAGTGRSKAAEPYPTTADRARDLAALLDALSIKQPVTLVGWSLGGLIVQHFAALNPARVAGVVLVDPTPVDTFSAVPAWQRALMKSSLPARAFTAIARRGWLRGPRAQRWLQKMLEAQLGPHFDRNKLPRLLEAVSDPLLHETVLMESRRLEECCADVAQVLERQGLPKTPLIVLTAGYRGKRPGKAVMRVGTSHAHTAASVPGGELRELKDVGHHVPFEAPEAIVQAVRDVLTVRS
jgi:pimeloyl-ACP methyl ester carboxylesterase